MDLADTELIGEFVVESQEGLANIENQMLSIEAAGENIDPDLVNAVFRTMHSIKGAAGFLGLDRIGTLAHSLEEVLNNLRNREVVPTSELVSAVLAAADFMKGLIDTVDSSNDADVSPYVEKLQRFRPGMASAHRTPPLSEAAREFVVECFENLDSMDRDLLALEQNPSDNLLLRSVFRTMHTIKGGAGFLGLGGLERLGHAAESLLGMLRDGERELTVEITAALLATVDRCREGLRHLEAHGCEDAGFDSTSIVERLQSAGRDCACRGSIDSTSAAPPTLPIGEILVERGQASAQDVEAVLAVQRAGDSRLLGEILVERGAVKPEQIASAVKQQQETRGGSACDGSIRVDVALLDKLMTRVGELVLARNQILQRTNASDDAEFVSTAQRLNLITTELQEGVMKTRMQPIGNVWAKFPRVVRDLSAQLNKQVRIEMEGKETELDKTIVEAIKDPLTHLVRNSVDHGIESPAVRRSAGKPEEGRLLLRAYHEGGQVNIEITDDGAGLNLERIRKKAIEKGLIGADQAARLSDREAIQLILLPGFSTAEQVTSVSGRGVGMDVVKTNIEKIGGTLDLQSRPGHGTTVKIKIPLTLAIIPAMIVTTGGDRYAIPQVSLLELVRLEGEQAESGIEYVHGAPVYRLRGKLLPLVYLAERLGLTAASADVEKAAGERTVNIIVLRANDRQYGLVVDKVNDTEEIVVKPLSRQLKGLGEYAGTTIMGDGAVALILDVMGLAIASGLAAELRDPTQTVAVLDERQAGERQKSEETQTLLVVDLGDTRRFALPTSMVARLEKVPPAAIEHANGREVIQYRGAILPLVRLRDVLGASERDDSPAEDLQIVVYAEEGNHCGFVVQRILDIVETELRLDAKNDENDNLLGTTVIQQRVTDVLNLRTLARCDNRAIEKTSLAL